MRARRFRPTLPPLPSAPERARQAEAITPPDVNGTAVRRWWSVRSRLDALLAEERISPEAHAAAVRLRDDFQRVAGVASSPLGRIGVAGVRADRHAMALAKVEAATRLRLARERIGADAFAVVVLVAIADQPWSALARRLGCSDKTAKRAAAEAIEGLAGDIAPT